MEPMLVIFASHFGHLSLMFVWLSGMYFSGARFSNYEAWLHDPTHVRPSSQVAWAGLNQDVLNGDQGAGLRPFASHRVSSIFGVGRGFCPKFSYSIRHSEAYF